jgi:hypothetical protein
MEAVMRAKMAVGGFLMVLIVGTSAGAAEVSLSRLVVRQKSETGLSGIDAGTLTRFCGDDDGCEVVVSLKGPNEAASLTTRLFVNAGINNRWFAGQGTSSAYSWDSDGGADAVFSLVSGAYTCAVDDGDSFDPGLDFNVGFEIGVFGGVPNEATCVVTISD